MCDQHCRNEWKSDLSFLLTGVVNISIAFVGLMLNLFGIFAIRRIKEKHLFHKLITCLIVTDSCVLVLSIVDGVYRGLKIRYDILAFTYPYLTHPCLYICVCGSIFMTVCISHERYSALKDPVRYSNGRRRLQKHHFLKYVMATILLSITYNIPRFFDLSLVCFTNERDYNASVLDFDIMVAKPDDLSTTVEICNEANRKRMIVVRKHFIFDDYNKTFRSFELEKNEGTFRISTSVADCIFMGVVPFALLIFFNAWIYIFVKKQRKIVSRYSGSGFWNPDSGTINEAIHNGIRMQEIRMAMSFISIVIVFVTCYSFWLVHGIITAITYWKYDECQNSEETHPICDVSVNKGFIAIESIGHLLITFNSSVNILLYGLSWNQFQEVVKELIEKICPCVKFEKTERKQSFENHFFPKRTWGYEDNIARQLPMIKRHIIKRPII